VLFACSKKQVSAGDYVKYVEEESNGLKVSKNMGDIKYLLQYKPIDYVLLKENPTEPKIKKEDVEGMQYFTLSYALTNQEKDVLRYNLSGQADYYERVNYMSYGLQQDIYLVDGKDTLPCILFNFVRAYGLSPKADVMLGFEKNKSGKTEDKLIVLVDKVFNGGIIKLKVSKKDIEKIPQVK
jgi:hypothetical protein